MASKLSGLTQDLKTEPSTISLGKIADLLERNGIAVEDVGRVKRISLYQTITKDKEGNAEVHDLQAIQLSPAWEDGPQWPVIHPGPAVRLPSSKIKPKAPSDYKTAVILPDIQIGYFRDAAGNLVSTQDEEAIEVCLGIIRQVQPDEIILLGDNLDLPEFGKYRLTPAFLNTSQASIDRGTTLCAELRAASPHSRIRWIAGNHEERMPNYLLDNASAAFGLKRGNVPHSWPVMSVPYLCRMDEFNVEYVPGYPAGETWLNQNLKIIHGGKHKSNGSTAHMYLNTEKVSVIYGHVHRREWAEKTRGDWDGPKTIMAASPGCLAKITGEVPSTKGSKDLDGRPMTCVEDWQQGLAVVTFEDHGHHRFWYEQIPIHNGAAMYRGRLFTSEEDNGPS